MFPTRLACAQERIAAHLERRMAHLPEGPVTEAMRYAVQGGKRLRGFLVLESAALHGIGEEIALDAAAAVECLHAYSLVHDDLPSMDNDDLRRGLPTVHIKWDEATAVLAGDALQTFAFELLTLPQSLPAGRRLALVAELARASGAEGMVYGQALDIAAETASTPLTLAEITRLQAGKTGALIRFSAMSGALMAGADPAPLAAYADAIGLAFQIADDLLDVEGDADKAGKKLRKDAEAGKATFVSLLGIAGARARAEALVAEAGAALAPYGSAAATLIDTARFTISRDS